MLSPLASGQKKAPKCVTSGGNIGSCFKIQNQRRRRRHRRRSRARAELWTPEPTRRRRRRRPIRRQLVGIILLLNEINVHPPPLPLALARLAVCSSSGSSPQLDEASNCGVAYPVALSSHVATVSAKMARPTARQTHTHTYTCRIETDVDTRTHNFDLQTQRERVWIPKSGAIIATIVATNAPLFSQLEPRIVAVVVDDVVASMLTSYVCWVSAGCVNNWAREGEGYRELSSLCQKKGCNEVCT